MCDANGDALPAILSALNEGYPLAEFEPELRPVELQTEEAREVVGLFFDLHSARGSTGFGVNPIGYDQLAAFVQLTRQQLSVWTIEQIRNLDRLFLNAVALANKVTEK